MQAVTIRQEGTSVLLIIEGKAVLNIPWEGAKELARGIQAKALKAEQLAKKELVIYDSAIAFRAGLPFTFSSNPVLRGEAVKVAQYDPKLRRYMPGIKSREIVGTPTVILGPGRLKL